MESTIRHILVTVHGIRTYGDWQERLERLLSKEGIEVHNYKYGYYSIAAFIFPPTRWLITRRFRQWLLSLMEPVSDHCRLDIVAHSFGTHLVSWALKGLAFNKRPKVHTLILAGSVLKSTFRWETLLNDRSVFRLVNECGVNDSVLLANQLCVPLTGIAGRVGFTGGVGERFRNRYHDFGHSGYFETPEDRRMNDFMIREWLPVLTGNGPIQHIDNRKPTTILGGMWLFLLNNAEPIKLLVFISPLIALTLYFRMLQLEAERQQQIALQQRNMAVSKQLAAQSMEHLNDEIDLSLLLSIEAFRTPATVEAKRSLLLALQREPQLVSFLRGHHSEVTAIAFSPGGNLMASGSCVPHPSHILDCRSGEIALWDVVNGERGPTLNGHAQSVVGLTFSPDGGTIASVGKEGTILFWDVEKRSVKGGQMTVRPEIFRDPEELISAIAFTKDLRSIVLGTTHGTIVMWDLIRQKPRWKAFYREMGVIRDVAISRDEKKLASTNVVGTGDNDATIEIWNLTTGRRLGKPLKGNARFVSTFVFSPDGTRLASGGCKGGNDFDCAAGELFVWDLITRRSVATRGGAFQLDSQHRLFA